MRTYECMVLLDNRDVRQGWQQLKDSVSGMFTKHGVKIVSARRWAERRLAYPIRHNGAQHLRGTYLLVYFEGETSANGAIRRELELSDQVMRYLTMQCEEIPADAHEPEEAFDEAEVPVEEVTEIVQDEEDTGDGEGAEGGEASEEKAGEDAGEKAADGDGESTSEAKGEDAAETVEAGSTDAGGGDESTKEDGQ